MNTAMRLSGLMLLLALHTTCACARHHPRRDISHLNAILDQDSRLLLGPVNHTLPPSEQVSVQNDTTFQPLVYLPGSLPDTGLLPQDPLGSLLPSQKPLVTAYFPDWLGDSFAPENISFSRFDFVDFAFAMPTANGSITWDDAQVSPPLLDRLVVAAHAGGSKVKLSVGGATGSQHFSTIVSTPELCSEFARNLVTIYTTYNLDGLDFDWEFPATQSDGTSIPGSNDTSNYLAFLELLRSMLPPDSVISIAASTTVFLGPNGQPVQDLSAFANVVDWIMMMNYDAFGSASDPGPNAPLSDGCGNSTEPEANAVYGYDAFVRAGIPAHQLMLGVPSYGYISHSTATALQDRRRRRRDSTNAAVVHDDSGTTTSGTIQFSDLVAQGALVLTEEANGKGNPTYNGSGGFNRQWDICSSTPWIENAVVEQVVTYDDPVSLGLKAAFSLDVGMRGVAIWDVHGDTKDWVLTDAIRRALGLPAVAEATLKPMGQQGLGMVVVGFRE